MNNGISLSLMMAFFPECYQDATLLLVLSVSCSLILIHGVSRILPRAYPQTVRDKTLWRGHVRSSTASHASNACTYGTV